MCESFELADGHLVEVSDCCEELYDAGCYVVGSSVFSLVCGFQFFFVVFEEVGVDDEFASLDEFLVDLLPVLGVLMSFYFN